MKTNLSESTTKADLTLLGRPINASDILTALLQETTDSIWAKDKQGKYLLINAAGARFLGKTIDQIVGKTDYEVFPPETADKVVMTDRQVMDSGATHTVEDLLVTPDGSTRVFQAVKSVFRDQYGEVQGVIGTVRDITEQRKAEEALRIYTAKLEQSNKDLEHFAFIASHDLQAPLRKTILFSNMLQKHIGKEGQENARRLQKAVEKMQHFIIDLLALSRVNRKGKPFREVSVNTVIDEVLEDLDLQIQEQEAKIQIDTPGSIYGDFFQLSQLFSNLVSNSLKFKRPDIASEITIKGEILPDGDYQIVFQDNGIGFKNEYVEKIFQPFERLHGDEEFTGTGMGLAICKKIVERHEGQITATGQEGKGAVFILRFPKKPRSISEPVFNHYIP